LLLRVSHFRISEFVFAQGLLLVQRLLLRKSSSMVQSRKTVAVTRKEVSMTTRRRFLSMTAGALSIPVVPKIALSD